MASISTDARRDLLHDISVWERRLERWRHVRHLLDRAELSTGRLRRECVQAATSELKLLAEGERLWAFPGPARIIDLALALTDVEPADAAMSARWIVRLLELYGDAASVADRDLAWVERYFTVLVVGDDAARRAIALGMLLGSERREGDRRAYSLVALDGLDAATEAVRVNPWVEAVLTDVPAMAERLAGARSSLTMLPTTLPAAELHARLCAVG